MNVQKQLRVLHRASRAGWISRELFEALRTLITQSPPRHADEVLAFAGSLGELAPHEVHIVVDTIHMAVMEGGTTLNLRWSYRRWKREHDLLARSLSRKAWLERAAIPFETQWLERVLEAGGKGCDGRVNILRTSADLVREGDDLEHCLPSYFDRFRRGRIGGVSLNLDGERWTITLLPPADGGHRRKASIHEIRGKRNVLPGNLTRQRILAILGPEVEDSDASSHTRPAPPSPASALAYDQFRQRYRPRGYFLI